MKSNSSIFFLNYWLFCKAIRAVRFIIVLLLWTITVCLAANELGDEITIDLGYADWDDVVRKLNGKVRHPIEFNGWFITVLGLFCAVAVPLNVDIIFRIASDKKMRLNRDIHHSTLYDLFESPHFIGYERLAV